MPLLALRHITRRYGSFVAVHDINLSLDAGEFFTLLGPSGCGKTTLLRMIGGLEPPDSGSIWLNGEDITDMPAEKRPICTVFQSYALFPHMTVEQNVGFGLRMAGKRGSELTRSVNRMLEEMSLDQRSRHYPHQLSGGERQRVALARAMINRPQLLLLDEPLAALDAKLREDIQLDLINLQRDAGITFVYVTHAQQEALALSHRIGVMNCGSLVQQASPTDLYARPNSRFVADFIGHANLLNGTLIGRDGHEITLKVDGIGSVVTPSHSPPGIHTNGCLVLRPEHLHLLAQTRAVGAHLKNHFPGSIQSRLYSGDVTVYHVRLQEGASLEVMMTNASPRDLMGQYQSGDSVWVEWRHDAGLFLPD